MVKGVTFGGQTVHAVRSGYQTPSRSRPYGAPTRKTRGVSLGACEKQRRGTRAAEISAHTNALRLHAMDSAESVLVVLGKLRSHRPSVWDRTGIESATEDSVCQLCDDLDKPPSPKTVDAWQVDALANRLGVTLARF